MAQDFQSNQYKTGQERLALIGKHSQALMTAYQQGRFDDSQVSEGALKKLLQARLLWRPDEQQGLKLSHHLIELIASMVKDERRRHINTDVADCLVQIHNQVQAYQEAQSRADYVLAEHSIERLEHEVLSLNSQFAEAIDSLWHRLNSDFGFVSNLTDKIRENERAQKQILRLLDGLDLIDFDELIQLCGTNGRLRKLLVSQLQSQLSQHHSSLFEVQKRLVHLMARFRKQQERNQLVHQMADFLRQHPNFQPSDYSARTEVHDLINQAAPIVPRASLSLDRTADLGTIAELIRQLPKRSARPEDTEAAPAQALAEPSWVATEQQALKLDVEDYFVMALSHAEPSSALAHLQRLELPHDPEIWLFQVLAEYQSLPLSDQGLFQLHKQEAPSSALNRLWIITDLVLVPKHAHARSTV